jgi:hypothetical protein
MYSTRAGEIDEEKLEAIVDVLMEAEKTADSPTVFTRWHHAAEALIAAGYERAEYEYAIMNRYPVDKAMGKGFTLFSEWRESREEREEMLKSHREAAAQWGSSTEYKLVRRRKAGEVEDA